MSIQTTYANASANLAKLCDIVIQDREIVIIHRHGTADVALIAADELNGLFETIHLLRSPKNAQRLLTALTRALEETVEIESVANLRTEIGLDHAG